MTDTQEVSVTRKSHQEIRKVLGLVTWESGGLWGDPLHRSYLLGFEVSRGRGDGRERMKLKFSSSVGRVPMGPLHGNVQEMAK